MSVYDYEKFMMEAANKSGNELIEFTSKHNHLLQFFKRLFHPTHTTGLSNKWLKQYEKITNRYNLDYTSPFNLFDDLVDRKITGHDAIYAVGKFIETYGSTQLTLNCPLSVFFMKSPKIGMSLKSMNRAFPSMFVEFAVVLAKEFKPTSLSYNDWYISRKLDGVRCVAEVNSPNDIKFYSRKGKELHTLSTLIQPIQNIKFDSYPFYLDGEVYLKIDGVENFQDTMKQITKKNHVMKNAVYCVWDVLTGDEFWRRTTTKKYGERYQLLKTLIPSTTNNLCRLEQILYKNDEDFQNMEKLYSENNWEGLMFRRNVPYEAKRTWDLMKYKNFKDDEFKIVDVTYGVINISVANEGRNEEYLLKNITIEYPASDGNIYRVDVGSGFNIDQRRTLTREQLIGKMVTVRYFEETRDKDGNFSLRFPTLVYLHESAAGRLV